MVILTLQMTDVILSLFYQPPVPEVYLQDQKKYHGHARKLANKIWCECSPLRLRIPSVPNGRMSRDACGGKGVLCKEGRGLGDGVRRDPSKPVAWWGWDLTMWWCAGGRGSPRESLPRAPGMFAPPQYYPGVPTTMYADVAASAGAPFVLRREASCLRPDPKRL